MDQDAEDHEPTGAASRRGGSDAVLSDGVSEWTAEGPGSIKLRGKLQEVAEAWNENSETLRHIVGVDSDDLQCHTFTNQLMACPEKAEGVPSGVNALSFKEFCLVDREGPEIDHDPFWTVRRTSMKDLLNSQLRLNPTSSEGIKGPWWDAVSTHLSEDFQGQVGKIDLVKIAKSVLTSDESKEVFLAARGRSQYSAEKIGESKKRENEKVKSKKVESKKDKSKKDESEKDESKNDERKIDEGKKGETKTEESKRKKGKKRASDNARKVREVDHDERGESRAGHVAALPAHVSSSSRDLGVSNFANASSSDQQVDANQSREIVGQSLPQTPVLSSYNVFTGHLDTTTVFSQQKVYDWAESSDSEDLNRTDEDNLQTIKSTRETKAKETPQKPEAETHYRGSHSVPSSSENKAASESTTSEQSTIMGRIYDPKHAQNLDELAKSDPEKHNRIAKRNWRGNEAPAVTKPTTEEASSSIVADEQVGDQQVGDQPASVAAAEESTEQAVEVVRGDPWPEFDLNIDGMTTTYVVTDGRPHEIPSSNYAQTPTTYYFVKAETNKLKHNRWSNPHVDRKLTPINRRNTIDEPVDNNNNNNNNKQPHFTRSGYKRDHPDARTESLRSIYFECAYLGCTKRLLLHRHPATLQCRFCGPFSLIRYCSNDHRLSDAHRHHFSCGLYPIVEPMANQDHNSGHCNFNEPIRNVAGLSNAFRTRQLLHFMHNPYGKYTLFLNSTLVEKYNLPVGFCLDWNDPRLDPPRSIVCSIFKIAFENHQFKCIVTIAYIFVRRLMHRTLNPMVPELFDVLAAQFAQEFDYIVPDNWPWGLHTVMWTGWKAIWLHFSAEMRRLPEPYRSLLLDIELRCGISHWWTL